MLYGLVTVLVVSDGVALIISLYVANLVGTGFSTTCGGECFLSILIKYL